MEIVCPSFDLNERIPVRYTCDGENVNPPFEFFDVPKDAVSLALSVEDPDAPGGTFYHWILWNIDPRFDGIGEGNVTKGSVEGFTSNGCPGYTGPCPPKGIHRYYFKLYALPGSLEIPQDTLAAEAVKIFEEKAVAYAETMGVYEG